MESSNVKYTAYKENKGDKVWWVNKTKDGVLVIGEELFTFDKKTIYNLFRDYPSKLSVDEWLTFNAENEYWKNYFKDRNLEYALEHLKEIEKLGGLKETEKDIKEWSR